MWPRFCATLILVSSCGAAQPTHFTDGGDDAPAQVGHTYLFNFDTAATGALPDEWVSSLGTWAVSSEPTAPSSENVLRQTATFGDPDFPRAIVKSLVFGDLRLRVRCRPESGSTDQACGLMFRLQDSDNYLLTRANALEGNIRLYHVVQGVRSQVASADRRVASGEWHTLEVRARGTGITVAFDGEDVLSAADPTFDRGDRKSVV